ncbi:molybdopterin-dependent oxidoreductase [Kineobactrum salinum]|uniref:Molybdopterin-dependent oxidoreductase n=1 Tax=Kineobactrum salinum TaxID=2708301 RepID=A0A6C0U0G7_9GAMM|nr:molybdopterin-dependent oxidoreductase [Kineobactrum salinum]QIB65069.1 molybdopterin-dependent oxidoreductase [Kineobactrum salinum]
MTILTRRQALLGALSVAGISLTGCNSEKVYLPPNAGKLLGISFGASDAMTLASQRLLLDNDSMARELPENMISENFPAIGTTDPGEENRDYRADQNNGFPKWRLSVSGLVERPLVLSLADIRSMPFHSQITLQSCERGWSAIAKWTGVRLAHVLDLARLKPNARWIMFQAIDGWWDCLDLFDAVHPQTILAYGMNDGALPVPNGAPVRLRVERALGWKSMKYINAITVLDSVEKMPEGKASMGIPVGFPWYGASRSRRDGKKSERHNKSFATSDSSIGFCDYSGIACVSC